jgi:hypothetical protein
MNRRDVPADQTVLYERTGHKRFHLPERDARRSIACPNNDLEDPYRIDREDVPPGYKLCATCSGENWGRLDGESPSHGLRQELLEADPEDFGLDPIPNSEAGRHV